MEEFSLRMVLWQACLLCCKWYLQNVLVLIISNRRNVFLTSHADFSPFSKRRLPPGFSPRQVFPLDVTASKEQGLLLPCRVSFYWGGQSLLFNILRVSFSRKRPFAWGWPCRNTPGITHSPVSPPPPPPPIACPPPFRTPLPSSSTPLGVKSSCCLFLGGLPHHFFPAKFVTPT